MPRKTIYTGGLNEGNPPASMRPRPDAAENSVRSVRAVSSLFLRFNEAAARCRGKRLPPPLLMM